MAQHYDDLNIPAIGTLGVVAALLSFATIIGTQAIYYAYERAQFETKKSQIPFADSDHKLNEQRGRISSFGWVDRKNDVVAIPIDQAMELVVKEQGPST
jgi:hypothetical protein